MYFRTVTEGDIAQLWQLAKETDLERDWLAIWSRFGNWVSSPPIVAVDGNAIIGVHMFTLPKRSKYLYTQFIWVIGLARGQSVAKKLINYTLTTIPDLARWKFLCYKDNSLGLKLWDSMNIIPIGESERDFIYDVKLPSFQLSCTDDNITLSAYKRRGVKFTHPAWVHLNG